MKKILFTGGGSAGHVTPNMALITFLRKLGWEMAYVGSSQGIEKKLITAMQVPYFAIATGKLRRYFSWQNFVDPFKILYGVAQAFWICRKLKPDVVFSKGGFVAFPVVVAAWLQHIPVIVHESDLTIGLANKLCLPFATKICLAFAETARFIADKTKTVVTGTPIRPDFFTGDAAKGLAFCGFNKDKKVLLVIGGSLGARLINQVVYEALDSLLQKYQIVHICGQENIRPELDAPSYKQFAYLTVEFANVLAAADLVISRAGANAIYELVALRKPHILIPLSRFASRGDQIVNANYFAGQGLSQVIFEAELTPAHLCQKLEWLDEHLAEVKARLNGFVVPDSVQLIYELLKVIQ